MEHWSILSIWFYYFQIDLEMNNHRPQRSWGKVMFLQVSVILSTGGEYLTWPKGCTWSRGGTWPGTPPGTRYTPLGPGTPPRDQVHPLGPGTPPRTRYIPRTRYTPWDQVCPPGPGTPPRTRYTLQTSYTPQDQVCPPWTRYIPPRTRYTPSAEHAGRYGQRVGGTHPTGMQSCFGHESIRQNVCNLPEVTLPWNPGIP